ncbi:MAG: amidohydrolase family protein [Salinivirgaceae bacterium]|jgi:predicted TIM-barrel fold metal-dependent hydrolase|nr:amidohydrolase family protein [Salinivirgaceae bacterium]
MRHCFLLLIATILLAGCAKENSNLEIQPIAEKYKDVLLIDIHNHDASGGKYKHSFDTWNSYAVDKIVLFGDISEPSAQNTDEIAFTAYQNYRDRIIPFIAGINIYDTTCFKYIRENFEKGVMGIGEVVGASTYSPVTSNLPWKGDHPLDGYFPQIYEICAEYNRPILLHLDPPNGNPIVKLREAADLYPETNFIFGHANAYNTPENIEVLLKNHTNIYIDYFAGWIFNSDASHGNEDYIELIKAYPNRFMVSTDGGYGVGYKNAYSAIYELFDLLDEEIVVKIAGQNFLNLFE